MLENSDAIAMSGKRFYLPIIGPASNIYKKQKMPALTWHAGTPPYPITDIVSVMAIQK